MFKRLTPPARSLLCHGIGAAMLTLSAGCLADTPSGYLMDGTGQPVQLSHGYCLKIGPLNAEDKKSECYKRAHEVVPHHIEPLPRDEFGFLLPPEPVAKKQQIAGADNPDKPATPQYVTKTVRFTTPLTFKINHAGLSAQNRSAVFNFINSLEQYRGVESIHIIGHTDLNGSRHYNQWLAGKRAESVKLRLLSLGVDPRTLSVSAEASGGRNVVIEVTVRVPAK